MQTMACITLGATHHKRVEDTGRCEDRMQTLFVNKIGFLVFLFLFCVVQHAAAEPVVYGKHAILFDANTGEVLYKKNDTVPTPIASTQKLLTAVIVARAGDLDRPIPIPLAATLVEPTKLYLKAGDYYTRRALLHALLIRSANDAAVALAMDNAGSVAGFATRMNTVAKQFGAQQSNFVNPNGLPADGQVSTARDLACIARAAYRIPDLRAITAMSEYAFRFTSGKSRLLTNTNRVLRTYTFCNGMKTGYTILSGHCLVASGAYNGKDMIAVVIGSDKAHVWDDAAVLLEYGLGVDRRQFARVQPASSPRPKKRKR